MASDFQSLFFVERQLGRGGFGSVFRVKCRKDNGLYALKVVNLSTVDYKEATKEIDVMKNLSHPNIVRYFGGFESYWKSDGEDKLLKLAIQMEFCAGGDLAAVIGKRAGIPFQGERLHKWMLQLSSAITYIHSIDILHRDLKPQNILLDSGSQLKLADFGISGIVTSSDSSNMATIGTHVFMAPEVQQERYGKKADVFSLGCVFLCLASCKVQPKPCPGAPFHAVPTTYGQAVIEVIRNCIQSDPSSRWSALQIHAQLLDTPQHNAGLMERLLGL